MISIKTKLNIFGIFIILITLVLSTMSIAWVLTENNISKSKIELEENMKMIQSQLDFNKKRLLASSQKTAELQELGLKIKHISRNKNKYNDHLKPLYIELANATHDSAKIAGNIWKTMIYDKEDDLISFSQIEQDYSKKGYAFDFPNASFMIADGKTLIDPLSNPWKKYSKYDQFNLVCKEKVPNTEDIIYSKNNSKLTIKSFYPVMGLNFDKKLGKMTSSKVGFVLSENPLDSLFIDEIKKYILNKEINIYLFDKGHMHLTTGTLKEYKVLSNTYATNQRIEIEGINYIQEVLPLYNNDELIGSIALLQIEKSITDYVLEVLKSLIIVFIIILIIVIPFTIILIRTITTPIINLQKGIKELSSGNLGKQLDIYAKDEIGELTTSFNNMSSELAKTDKIKILNTQLKKTSTQLIVAKEELEELNDSLEKKIEVEIEKNTKQQVILMHQSKLVQMGEMIENIAHQWRQPLSQINSSVLLLDMTLLKENIKNTLIDEKLEEIESLTAYMSKTIDDFKNFFNPDKQKSIFTIEEAIKKSLDIVKGKIYINRVTIDVKMNKELKCYCHLDELQQVVLTLLNNSLDALIIKNILKPKILIKAYKKDENILIEIEDNALGIDTDFIDKIFEPYFTTKHKTQGTGLGLYMSKMIIEEGLEGSLIVENRLNGACFIVEIAQGRV